MAENSQSIKKTNQKTNTLDWFMRGILAKLGEMVDSLTGRNWKPSSSLATSELIERLKALLDAKIRDAGARGKFVPHKITLKMQWNKFSPDEENSDLALKKLEKELLIAVVDHINDRRYHTFAPLTLEIKQDYFTEGVKFAASFGDLGADEGEMNVTVPEIKIGDFTPPAAVAEKSGQEIYIADFMLGGTRKQTKLVFNANQRLSVGRTGANDLAIDDSSVSKIHASLMLNFENKLVVADTGSTNGTFINDQRISYGKAHIVETVDKIKFGSIEVSFFYQRRATENSGFIESISQESVVIGDFEFKSRPDFKADSATIAEVESTNSSTEKSNLETAASNGSLNRETTSNLPKQE